MSEVILKAIKQHADSTAEQLKSLSAQGRESELRIDALAQQLAGGEGFEPSARKSVLSTVTKSAQIESLRNRSATVARVPLSNVSVKSLVSDVAGVGNELMSTVATRHDQMANDPRPQFNLLSALQSVNVETGVYEFVSLNGYESASDYQLKQGDKKKEQQIPSELKQVTAATIAVYTVASTQILADSGNLGQWIQSRLTHDVLKKLENEIVSGAGGQGKILGLSAQAQDFTATSAATVDQILEASVELQASGFTATHCIMHPRTWATLRSERSTDGVYLAGSWAENIAPAIYGLSVILNSAIAETEVLVMDSNQIMLVDRMSPTYQIGHAGDSFIQNELVCLVELRSSVAVLAPASLQKITITP